MKKPSFTIRGRQPEVTLQVELALPFAGASTFKVLPIEDAVEFTLLLHYMF